MSVNTSDFIEELVKYINTNNLGTAAAPVTCYYDRASSGAKFPYIVISSISASDLAAGDLTSFDLEIYTDDKKVNAMVQAEALCDGARNLLHNTTIRKANVFGAHIGYEGRSSIEDKEYDLATRRLFFAARIFYIN